MGRLRREFAFSLKSKKHVFFLMLVLIAGVCAATVFGASLEHSLKKSFPSDYGTPDGGKRTVHLRCTVDEMASVTDSDIAAELLFNQALHQADWMEYDEAAKDPVYIQNFTGPKSVLVANGSSTAASEKVELDGKAYAKVKAVWADSESVSKAQLGVMAGSLFRYPTDYLSRIYVMLGATYEKAGLYKTRDILSVRTGYGAVEAVVIGFLPEGATMQTTDGKTCLDDYMLCPLLPMDDLYGSAPTEDTTYTESIYLEDSFAFDFNRGTELAGVSTETHAFPAKTVWFDPALASVETTPESIRKVISQKNSCQITFVYMGASYEKNGMKPGTSGSMSTTSGVWSFCCVGFFPEGLTATVDGQEICLDDYIGIAQFDLERMLFPEADAPEPKAEETTEGEGGEVLPPVTPVISYTLAERTKLFYVIRMKNQGLLETTLTADEAARKLMKVTDASWRAFRLDNKGIEPITEYYIAEAKEQGHVVYRDDISRLQKGLERYGSWMFVGCGVLLLLYFIWKLRGTKEYFTILLLTGSSVFEFVGLLLLEALLLFAGSMTLGYALGFVAGRVLGLTAVSCSMLMKPVLLCIGLPALLAIGLTMFRDYGKMFRRVK